jgi:hypothetical protein
MSIIKVGGKEFLEETVKKALQAHCNFESDVIPLKRGDVVRNGEGLMRIIFQDNHGKLSALSCDMTWEYNVGSDPQEYFQMNDYKKVGVLSNYIK